MSRNQSLSLQLELLRLRGELERAQAAVAMIELRTSTRRIGAFAAAVGNLSGSQSGLLGAALDVVGAKAKWAPLALVAVRSARRHPIAAALAVAAAMAVVGWLSAGRRQKRSEPGEGDGDG